MRLARIIRKHDFFEWLKEPLNNRAKRTIQLIDKIIKKEAEQE